MKKYQLILFICCLCITNIHVFAQPDWSVNTAAYNLDGTIVASLSIDNVLSVDTADKVAAFDSEGNVRGVAHLTLDNITNTYVAYLTVVSATYGDELTFKIYDASEDMIYLSNNEPVVFESNLDLGSIFSPYQIEGFEAQLGVEKREIEGFSLYPNPVKDYFTISSKSKLEELFVYNSLGVLVLYKKVHSHYLEVDARGLKKGSYFAKVTSKGTFEVVPLLKE